MEHPWWSSGKESTLQCRRQGFNHWFHTLGTKIPQLGKPASHNEEPPHCNEDPAQPKNKNEKIKMEKL